MRTTLTIPVQTGLQTTLTCLDTSGNPVDVSPAAATIDGGICSGPNEEALLATFDCVGHADGTVSVSLPHEASAPWHKSPRLWWWVRVTFLDAPAYPELIGFGPVVRGDA